MGGSSVGLSQGSWLKERLRSNPAARDLFLWYVRRRGRADDRLGREVWAGERLEAAPAINAELAALIASGKPFSAGRAGANEQNLLMWAYGVRVPTGIPFYQRGIAFHQTSNCATNAGIVPRSVDSYRRFAELLDEAIGRLRVLGLLRQPGEHRYLAQRRYLDRTLCYFFDLEPFFVADPWTHALAGKRVLLVTPFAETARRQHGRLDQVWPNRLMPEFDLVTYRFPYLFSAAEQLGWPEVHADFAGFVESTEFDVAIIGAGGMSLLLAEQCRRAGRQALYIGGSAQLLFGIRGARYEADPKFAELMNQAWVRPDRSETPPEAQSIEHGCYW